MKRCLVSYFHKPTKLSQSPTPNRIPAENGRGLLPGVSQGPWLEAETAMCVQAQGSTTHFLVILEKVHYHATMHSMNHLALLRDRTQFSIENADGVQHTTGVRRFGRERHTHIFASVTCCPCHHCVFVSPS